MLKDQVDLATMQVEAERWTKNLIGDFLETWDGGLSDGARTGYDDESDEGNEWEAGAGQDQQAPTGEASEEGDI